MQSQKGVLHMKESILSYSVGPLLYCPANRADLALSVQQEKFGRQYSLALCLEDTINDRFLAQAEEMFLCTLTRIYAASQTRSFFIPKIFVRVRHVSQIKDLLCRLKEASALLTGFILPKFDLSNANDYIRSAAEINQNSDKPYYVMPILESPAIIDIHRRAEILYEIRDKLQAIEDIVLNIRVGGNDLCHAFGFRRDEHTSIHNILPIASIFSDIITVFGRDYVVSGPVWEYYSQIGWDTGLIRELSDDRLCGFIGKTVIHPRQIPLVNQAYAVRPEDLNDAEAILNWDPDNPSLVAGSRDKQRMNEYKTHANWAKKILFLSRVYGVQQTER